jgi:hypothetical protein
MAFVLATIIVFVYIMLWFMSGKLVEENIQGSWVLSTCLREEISFSGRTFVCDTESGYFRVRWNRIYFGEYCVGYVVSVSSMYLEISDRLYFRK